MNGGADLVIADAEKIARVGFSDARLRRASAARYGTPRVGWSKRSPQIQEQSFRRGRYLRHLYRLAGQRIVINIEGAGARAAQASVQQPVACSAAAGNRL